MENPDNSRIYEENSDNSKQCCKLLQSMKANDSEQCCKVLQTMKVQCVDRSEQVEPVIHPVISLQRGSFSQADMRFGNSRNKQCAAISLTAVLQDKLKNVMIWTTADLDNVLINDQCFDLHQK